MEVRGPDFDPSPCILPREGSHENDVKETGTSWEAINSEALNMLDEGGLKAVVLASGDLMLRWVASSSALVPPPLFSVLTTNVKLNLYLLSWFNAGGAFHDHSHTIAQNGSNDDERKNRVR